jgi:hypothetical protein
MPKLSRNLTADTMHPRETLWGTGVFGAANAEVIIDADGCGTAMLDLRGTFSMTVELSGTVDGTNWTLIPVMQINAASRNILAAIAGTVAGTWIAPCAGFRKIRARVTSWTSGSAVAVLSAALGGLDPIYGFGLNTTHLVTATGAAAAAVTLTLPAPGVGLRQKLTYLSINRFAAAVLTAAATPVLVTTTNLPGAPVFSLPADAAAQGTLFPWREDFSYPLEAAAQNTAITVVCPVTTGVIWRVTAGYNLGA